MLVFFNKNNSQNQEVIYLTSNSEIIQDKLVSSSYKYSFEYC